MKVKCIDNKNNSDCLTIGKIYKVVDEYESCYKILDDDNSLNDFNKCRFIMKYTKVKQ